MAKEGGWSERWMEDTGSEKMYMPMVWCIRASFYIEKYQHMHEQ